MSSNVKYQAPGICPCGQSRQENKFELKRDNNLGYARADKSRQENNFDLTRDSNLGYARADKSRRENTFIQIRSLRNMMVIHWF